MLTMMIQRGAADTDEKCQAVGEVKDLVEELLHAVAVIGEIATKLPVEAREVFWKSYESALQDGIERGKKENE